MKVLSVRQPWAWMIIHAGKDIENRTWTTSYRGPLLIHAGLAKPTRDDLDWCRRYARKRGIVLPEALAYGQVIGQVDLVDCVTHSRSRWWMGPVGWHLRNPQPLSPWPLTGRLGLFEAALPSAP